MGRNLRHLPLLKRKQRLARLLTDHPRLFDVEQIEHEGLSIFADARALGLEGVVAKDAKSAYVEGPAVTWHWQKIKNNYYQRQEKVEFHPRKIHALDHALKTRARGDKHESRHVTSALR